MSEVGDMVRGVNGEYMIRPPEKCANGHTLHGHCIVAAQPCSCGDRHLSWCCNTCEHVTFGPPLGADCSVMNGPARVR
jgi:hypothetical protein